MYSGNYEESVAHGLDHIGGWARKSIQNALDFLDFGGGSRSGCLSAILLSSETRSVVFYFRDNDLGRAKQWAYVATKLRIMQEHERPGARSLEDAFWALISDNEEVFDWWRNHRLFGEDSKNPGAAEDIKSDVFIRRQTLRALNGNWNELGEACEQALAQPEAFKQVRPRLIQFSFYRELARGNVEGMRKILLEMCSPKLRSRSYQYESGLTNNFIVMLATLFAKMAWRHGYELEVDTPWIPKEWLPIRPNATYEDPWPFMQRFDIWQPFPEPWTRYSPQRPTS